MTSVYDVGVAMFWMLFLELENEAKAHVPLTCKSQNCDIPATWLVSCSGGSGVTLTVIMEENHRRDIWCTEMSRWSFSFSQVQHCSDWMKGIQNNPLDVCCLLFCAWSIKWPHTASIGQLCVFLWFYWIGKVSEIIFHQRSQGCSMVDPNLMLLS